MKAYTDLEQAKKLAEILPIESADMFYCYGMDIHTKKWDYDIVPTIIDTSNQIDIGDIPCWSLAALLEAMPEYIRKYDGRVYRNYHLNLYRSYYHCCGYSFGSTTTDDDDNTLYCIGRDNWVDACYGVIMKLHEEELL